MSEVPEGPPVARPQRPGFNSGLPQRTEVPRPRSVSIARILTLLALVAFAIPTALAVIDQEAIRAALVPELMDRAPDYSASDIDRAVLLTLAVIGGVGAVLALLAVSAGSALRRPGPNGRTALVVVTVLTIPVAVITQAFRDVPFGLALTGAQLLVLLGAVVLAFVPATGRWLRSKPPLEVSSMVSQQDRPAD